MSEWSTVFLGVIAVSALTMAAIQVGILIVAAKLAKSAADGVARVEAQLQPLVHRVERLGDQATDAMVKVVSGLERTEMLAEHVGATVSRATQSVSRGLSGPMGEVSALAAGARAVADRLGKKELAR